MEQRFQWIAFDSVQCDVALCEMSINYLIKTDSKVETTTTKKYLKNVSMWIKNKHLFIFQDSCFC